MADFPDRISFAALMVFMDICQTRSATETAKRLGLSLSHASNLLAKMEDASGLDLAIRDGGHLYINEQGLSIGKAIFPLANICGFVESWCAHDCPHWRTAEVRIPMRFWGGGISRALTYAIHAVRREHPDILLHCEFLDDYGDYQYRQTPWQAQAPGIGSIDVRYASDNAEVRGRWLLLSRDGNAQHITVPKMPWGIMQALDPAHTTFAYSDRDYTQWLARPLPRGEAVLVNELLLTATLRRHHHATPYNAAALPGLHCQVRGTHPALAAFRRHFLAAFANTALVALPPWGNVIRARQWRAFAALRDTGAFGKAAEALCVTQPALSKQIAALETRLGRQLVQREPGKRRIALTPAGQMLADVGQGIAVALDDLNLQISERRLRKQRQLTIGILPSVDAHSVLMETVMRHVEAWQERHPGLRVHVCEAPHFRLEQLLRSLDIQLAITEADAPWLVQYPVFAPEALGLVAPAAWFAKRAPPALDWAHAAKYPLVLLGKSSGIRRLIDRQCLQLGISLLPAVESESLNLNQSWVAQGRYATILPASAVRSLIARGDAVFIPLIPETCRQLKVSHLRRRELNDDERSLLESLIRGRR
ncbi:MAG: LysR family transcriptional regulator [Cardiobacteriaceae bacterium]|nr:LysR family transcriptional regulator [Cardiobacteriaceae bacterium]